MQLTKWHDRSSVGSGKQRSARFKSLLNAKVLVIHIINFSGHDFISFYFLKFNLFAEKNEIFKIYLGAKIFGSRPNVIKLFTTVINESL
jgi:hypothetical protein